MEVFNVPEVATYLNCSCSAIRRLVYTNGIPYFRVGKRILFRKLAIDDWVKQQELKHDCVSVMEEENWQYKN